MSVRRGHGTWLRSFALITKQITRSHFPHPDRKNAAKSTARPMRGQDGWLNGKNNSRRTAAHIIQNSPFRSVPAKYTYRPRHYGVALCRVCRTTIAMLAASIGNIVMRSTSHQTHPLFPAASPVRRIDVLCSYPYSHPEPMEPCRARVHPEKAITLAWSFGLRQLELQ